MITVQRSDSILGTVLLITSNDSYREPQIIEVNLWEVQGLIKNLQDTYERIRKEQKDD